MGDGAVTNVFETQTLKTYVHWIINKICVRRKILAKQEKCALSALKYLSKQIKLRNKINKQQQEYNWWNPIITG